MLYYTRHAHILSSLAQKKKVIFLGSGLIRHFAKFPTNKQMSYLNIFLVNIRRLPWRVGL